MTMRLFSTLRHLIRREEGFSDVWAIGSIPIFIIAAGLVIDGAGQVQTVENAQHVAAGAARAGTAALSGNLNSPLQLSLNASAATGAANDYLAAAGLTGTVTVTNNVINVTVNDRYDTVFLNLIPGFQTLPATGQASAQLIDEGATP